MNQLPANDTPTTEIPPVAGSVQNLPLFIFTHTPFSSRWTDSEWILVVPYMVEGANYIDPPRRGLLGRQQGDSSL